MALTTDQYIDKVYYAWGHGQPQANAGVISAAIEADLPRALQRLADITAKDPALAPLLQKSFSLTLTSGVVTLDATLLTSKEARQRYFVTLVGVTNPLQQLWNREDLFNPPNQRDYFFYTISAHTMVVRKYDGTTPTDTTGSLVGSYVPTVGQVPDELIDNIIDIGVSMIAEVPSLSPQVAQTASAAE